MDLAPNPPPTRSPAVSAAAAARREPQPVDAGTYIVTLTVGGKTYTKPVSGPRGPLAERTVIHGHARQGARGAHIVLGILGVLSALALLLIFGGAAGIVGATADPEARIAIPILGITGMALVVFVLARSLPGLLIGIGLLKHRPWARIGGIVLSIFEYSIWVPCPGRSSVSTGCGCSSRKRPSACSPRRQPRCRTAGLRAALPLAAVFRLQPDPLTLWT